MRDRNRDDSPKHKDEQRMQNWRRERELSERLFRYEQDNFSHNDGRSDRSESPPSGRKYKTELCHNWVKTGHCPYGRLCDFAHGSRELRQSEQPPKYKTQHCRNYLETGRCPYGIRCRFIHDMREAWPTVAQSAARNRRTSVPVPMSEPPVAKLGGMAALFETRWPGLQALWEGETTTTSKRQK